MNFLKKSQVKVGLALGSGGARGWAHIGAIKAIEELGIPIHCVAGTSMGALVGAVFASGKIDTLLHVATELDLRRLMYYFLEIKFPRMGLIDGSRITDSIREHVSPVDIEKLPTPFAAIATDAMTGEEIVMRNGNIINAVRASITIPGIFTPVTRDKRILIDGSLVNPLPVNIVRNMGAEYVIAVRITSDLNAHGSTGTARRKSPPSGAQVIVDQMMKNDVISKWLKRLNRQLGNFDLANLPSASEWLSRKTGPNIFDICENSIRIIERQITEMRIQREPPDLLIQPDLRDIGTMEFHRAKEAIEVGYIATKEQLAKSPILSLHT